MPRDNRLLTSEKDRVFGRVTASGMNAAEFAWEEKDYSDYNDYKEILSALRHLTSRFYFDFRGDSIEHSPGTNQRIETVFLRDDPGFPSKIHHLDQWLKNLKRELNAPDYWGKLLKERQALFAAFSSSDNVPFTIPEKKHLIESLDAIKIRVSDHFELQKHQAEILEQGFEEMKGALDRMGKKDWFNQAIGVVMNVIVAATFAPTIATTVFHQVTVAINSLFINLAALGGPPAN